MRDTLGGFEVGQVILPAVPGGSPASPDRQVNAPPAVEHRPALRLLTSADTVTHPIKTERLYEKKLTDFPDSSIIVRNR